MNSHSLAPPPATGAIRESRSASSDTKVRRRDHKTNRPSLVVLAPDDHQTRFQRLRFNPADFPDLRHSFDADDCDADANRGDANNQIRDGDLKERDVGIGRLGDDDDTNLPEKSNLAGDESKSSVTSGNGRRLNEARLQSVQVNESTYNDPNFDPYENDGDDDYPNENDRNFYNATNSGKSNVENPKYYDGSQSIASTNAGSVYIGKEAILDNLQRQLNLEEPFGQLFKEEFQKFDETQQRQLGRLGKLQIVKKRKWFGSIWKLFDEQDYESDGASSVASGMSGNSFNSRSSKNNSPNNNNPNYASSSYANSPNNYSNAGLSNDKLWASLRLFNMLDNPSPENQEELGILIEDPLARSLMKAAKETLRSFVVSDEGGLNLFMRAGIAGPVGSGKSVYLRFIFTQILTFLVEGGRFKDFFIVPLDFRHCQINSIESFYQYISSRVVESLIVQRPDLQLFENSLRKAFSMLTKVEKLKHLPKPISSQDYLRQSLKELEFILMRMHQCYNNPSLTDAFLTNVVLLPYAVAQIFSFKTPLLIIDHIDLLDIELRRKGQPSIQPLEFLKFGLTHCQYLISCSDGSSFLEILSALDEDSIDLRQMTETIYVYDTVFSNYETQNILVTFKQKKNKQNQRKLLLSASHCGGCPSFICKYDEVCKQLEEMNNTTNAREKREIEVQLLQRMSSYIEEMYDFEETPKIESFEFVENTEPVPGDEYTTDNYKASHKRIPSINEDSITYSDYD